MPGIRRLLSAAWVCAGLCACADDPCVCIDDPSRETVSIRSDLREGTIGLYVEKRYYRAPDFGIPVSDTTFSFHLYTVGGDTSAGGRAYRKVRLEELLRRGDSLVTYRGLLGVAANAREVRVAEFARPARRNASSLHLLKTAAPGTAATGPLSDTGIFDEVKTLEFPLVPGKGWYYREQGNPAGHFPAWKTYAGREPADGPAASDGPAGRFKFTVASEAYPEFPWTVWYDSVKMIGADIHYVDSHNPAVTQFVERRWVGARGFNRADSQSVAGRPGLGNPAYGRSAFPAWEVFP